MLAVMGKFSDVSSGDSVGVVVDNIRSLRVVAVMKSRMMAVVVGNVRSLRVVAVMKSQMGAMVEVSDVGCDEISDNGGGDSVEVVG